MGENLVKESFASARRLFFLCALLVEVRVFGQAGLANDFCHFTIPHACDGMVQQQFTSRTMVINQVAQTHSLTRHRISPERYNSA